MAVNSSLGGEPAAPAVDDGLAACVAELGRHAVLEPDEELRLAWAARAGDQRAAITLVDANLQQVVEIARCLAGAGVPFADLAEQASTCLLHAVDGFDPAGGCRFSAYAYWCVHYAVWHAAAGQRRPVRVPPATAGALDRLRRAAGHLAPALGREPSTEELATEMGTSVERVGRLLRLSRPASRLDGREPPPPADEVVVAALRVDLYTAVAGLTARERRVLRLRFGIVEGRPCSVEEIRRRLGVPRERVREIEKEALTKLRRATEAPRLAGPSD